MKHKLLFIFFCIILLIYIPSYGGIQEDLQQSAYSQNKPIKIKSSFKTKYTSNSDFNYQEKKEKPKKQSDHSFINGIFKFLGILIALINWNWIVYLIVGLTIAFLLYNFKDFFIELFANLKVDKPKSDDTAIVINEETLQLTRSVDFIHKINELKQQGNFREAIRFYFLYYLKTLENRAEIVYHKDKTNQQYFVEIKMPERQSQFKKRSNIFERVWYGMQELQEPLFVEYETLFIQDLK